MLIFGSALRIASHPVRQAIEERDAAWIQEKARRQLALGVQGLALYIGPQPRHGAAIMAWLVETVQAVAPVPLVLGTTNLNALRAGLGRALGPVWLSGAVPGTRSFDNMLALAVEHEAYLVGFPLHRGFPARAEARLSVVRGVWEALPESGRRRIYLDPLVATVNGYQAQATQALEAIRCFQAELTPLPKTIVPLYRVADNVPAEPAGWLQAAYLVLVMAVGVDALLLDPRVARVMDWWRLLKRGQGNTDLERCALSLYRAAERGTVDAWFKEAAGWRECRRLWQAVQVLLNRVPYDDLFLKRS